MISLKVLQLELKALAKEQKRRLKEKEYAEAARLQGCIETLEFVRDWNEE